VGFAGNRERDGFRGVEGVGCGMGGFGMADATLDQQFQVRRAGLVPVETEPERVLQMSHLKVVRTPGVIAIQERAVRIMTRHKHLQNPGF